MAAGANNTQSKGVTRRKSDKKDEKNPYAAMGRDKFSALLADVEEKKRTVLSQLRPEEVVLIQFVSSGDDKLKPIVVRANNSNKGKRKTGGIKAIKAEEQRPAAESEVQGSKASRAEEEGKQKPPENKLLNPPTRSLKEVELPKLQVQPTQICIGVIVVMVLLFLALFERYWRIYHLLEFHTQTCLRKVAD